MNHGARMATKNTFCFLHADTTLPANAHDVLSAFFSRREVRIGSFNLRFDHHHPLLSVYELFACLDTRFTRFGDQCIVVRRDFFEAIGGFPEWPMFEDVELLTKARKVATIHAFPADVVTSARSFVRDGIIRRQIKNGLLLGRFLLGASPELLSEEYYGRR